MGISRLIFCAFTLFISINVKSSSSVLLFPQNDKLLTANKFSSALPDTSTNTDADADADADADIDNAALSNTDLLTADQLNKKAYAQLKLGDYSQSYQVSKKALELAKQKNNTKAQARALNNLASNLSYLGEKDKALALYLQSLNAAKKANDLLGINRSLNNLAAIYDQLDDYDEALKYRKMQLNNSLKSKNKEDQLVAYIGLTGAHTELGNIERAIFFNTTAKKLLKEVSDPFLEIYVTYAETGILEKQGKYRLTIDQLKKALDIAKENQFNGLIVNTRANIAENLFILDDYIEATKEALLSFNQAKKMGYRSKVLQGHLLLTKIFEANKHYAKALFHSQAANKISDTLIGKRVRQLAEISRIDRQTLETEEKLKNAQQQQRILELSFQKQRDNQIIWLAAISIIFFMLFFFYYRSTSQREIVRTKMANLRLKELDLLKDRILKNTSHELRTPLNGIIGLSAILLEDNNELDQATKDMIQLIKSSGKQLALVIDDILEMSKIKEKQITIINSQFDLTSLVNDVVEICSPLAKQKNISITYPAQQIPQIISQDKTRLQQILFNIVGNAVKFTTRGGVSIKANVSNKSILIKVIDTGIGIPKDKLESVFESFEQLDNSNTRENKGSGLGLAICRDLVEAMGGEIKLSSQLGKGTIATVYLPIK